MIGARVQDLTGTVFQLRERCLSKKSQKRTSYESVFMCNDLNSGGGCYIALFISEKLFWNLCKLDISQKTDLPESGVALQRSIA